MKREEKSAVSRQRILAAAMEEFSRKGYEGASLSTLCAENPLYSGIFADAVFNTPPALAESVVSQLITGDMSDLEKAEALYAWVTANVEYDQRYYSDRNAMPYESQTALGALRDGIAICGGYSHAVKLLFEKAGIPCFNVTGTCQGENHMWNIARIDGQWLWFDATMDRGSDGQFGFLRFALKELDRNKYQWNEDSLSTLLD